MTKIISAILLFSLQSVLGQSINTQKPPTNIYQEIVNSEFDLVIRLDRDMNDQEIKARIGALHSLDQEIEISYSRDDSGNIKTLSSSGGQSSGSCMSNDFDFLIITLKDSKWAGCMISNKK